MADGLRSLLDRFPALNRLGPARRRRHVPYVAQVAASDCGAACLTMVLGYFRAPRPAEEVRSVVGAGRDGASAHALLEAADSFGLRGRCVRLEAEDIHCLSPGAILHWRLNHFVVLDRVLADAVVIVDPACGRQQLAISEFRRCFTGVAVLLEPSERLRPAGPRQRHVWAYARPILAESGTLSRIVVTSVLAQLFALALPVLTGLLVDTVVPRSDRGLLVVVGLGLLLLIAFDFVSSFLRAHLLLLLRTRLDAQMTLGFLDHMVLLPYAFFQGRAAGDLMARMNINSNVREILTSGVLSAVLDGVMVFLYLGLLMAASPKIGLLVLVLAALQLSLFVLTRGRQQRLLTETLQSQARTQSYQVELLAGMETLKALGSEHRAVQRWSHLFVDELNVSLARGRLDAKVSSLADSLRMASPLAVLMFGGHLVITGDLSLGMMLALSALAAGFLGPVATLVGTASQLQMLSSYVERIEDVLSSQREQAGLNVRPAPRLEGQVTLEHVSFRYDPHGPLVLEDVSLQIQPGQLVAIVGASGAGKSTLAGLLCGLYAPSAGRVLYDDIDYCELELRSLRQQLGAVTQATHLFAGSIRENIALSEPEASLASVARAAQLAHIHDEIVRMPMGYETRLSDQGGSLSGGQKQRVALARALLREPAVLLLDEATSALDAVSEAKVHHALANIECTRIVIAHRLSTVASADLIFVLDRGRLVEQGSHQSLLARNGIYARLVAAQVSQGAVRATG